MLDMTTAIKQFSAYRADLEIQRYRNHFLQPVPILHFHIVVYECENRTFCKVLPRDCLGGRN